MKKQIISYLVILLIVALGIFCYFNKKETIKEPPVSNNDNNPDKEKLQKLDNINTKIDYFKMDYLDRYLSYKIKNPNLKSEDIVIRVNIGLDNPYYTNTKITPYANKNYLLSNKYIAMKEDYIPDNLESIDTSCAIGGMKLVSEARVAFEKMCKDAKKDGMTIRAMSSYRSYAYQVKLYNNYVKQDGKEEADTYSARPGFSEHQTGLVTDIDNAVIEYTSFEKTKEFNWMKDNAYKYGFILRYPKGFENITGYNYESWHYRYVSSEIATYIHKNNITFDEYYVKYIEGKK